MNPSAAIDDKSDRTIKSNH